MAVVDLCHDGVLGSWASGAAGITGSPRLSFSRDLPAGDHHHHPSVERADAGLLVLGSPSSEFDFGMCAASPSSSVGGAAAADDLFADGMLLPMSIQKTKQKVLDVGDVVDEVVPSTAAPPPPPPPPPRDQTLKEIMAAPNPEDIVEADAKKPGRLSFWRFSRSCSVSGTGTAGGSSSSSNSRHSGLFFSLPLLRRTKSAGSEPSRPSSTSAPAAPKTQQHRRSSATTTKSKNGTNPKPNHPTPRRKSNVGGAPRPPLPSLLSSSTSSSSLSSSTSSTSSAAAASSSYYYGACHIGSASGGMRISPVINVPPACVHRSSSGSGGGGRFLGLGHLLLCSGGKKSFITAEQ